MSVRIRAKKNPEFRINLVCKEKAKLQYHDFFWEMKKYYSGEEINSKILMLGIKAFKELEKKNGK